MGVRVSAPSRNPCINAFKSGPSMSYRNGRPAPPHHALPIRACEPRPHEVRRVAAAAGAVAGGKQQQQQPANGNTRMGKDTRASGGCGGGSGGDHLHIITQPAVTARSHTRKAATGRALARSRNKRQAGRPLNPRTKQPSKHAKGGRANGIPQPRTPHGSAPPRGEKWDGMGMGMLARKSPPAR